MNVTVDIQRRLIIPAEEADPFGQPGWQYVKSSHPLGDIQPGSMLIHVYWGDTKKISPVLVMGQMDPVDMVHWERVERQRVISFMARQDIRVS